MLKSKRQQKILMGVVSTLAITIVFAISYAAFSQTLNINGTGTVRNSTWNIHFVGSGELEPSNSISNSVKVLSKPSIRVTTVGDYRVSLTTPGDTISYTFSVTNEGDYNAKISNFTLPTPVCKENGNQFSPNATKVCEKLTYELKYVSGSNVSTNDTLLSKETKTMILTLTYKEFDNEGLLPTADVEISNLGFTINYVQDGSAIVNNNDGSTPKIYDTYNVGDIVTLNNEQYYVLDEDNTSISYVTLLKAEPLTVEEVNNYGAGHVNRYTYDNVGIAYDQNGYGEVAYYSSETCGYTTPVDISSLITTGCTTDYNISEIKYVVDAWSSAKFTNGELATDKNGYQARLISISELKNLNYEKEAHYYRKNDNTPNWIWNSSYWYWTMSPYNDNTFVWYVSYDSKVYGGSVYDSTVNYNRGVRPVINVYKSIIE